MTLSEAVKLTGKPTVIRGCSRNELPVFFKSLGFKVGAEIGVYRGEFSERFCAEGLKLFSIDPWLAYSGAGRTQKDQDVQNDNYYTTRDRLCVYDWLSVIVRKTSEDALEDFEDESLDFVYIDGDHRLPAITFDVLEWSKKVRSGGIVSGHDYFDTPNHARNVICQVKTAVDTYTEANGIDSWWVLGNKYPSWMWFKP